MSQPTHRTRARAAAAAALATTLLTTSACGGSSDASSAEDGETELTVSLFGTFGYEEAGLFEQYEEENPGISIQYETTQGEDQYWPALLTRLNAGSGTADIQGIEVARIRTAAEEQADLWVDLASTSAAGALEEYPAWKTDAARTDDGRVLGIGTDIGPTALCYRSDLLEEAGLPSDSDELAAAMTSWEDYIALGEQFRDAAPEGAAWTDSAGGLFNAIISTEQEIYYGEDGEPIYDSNPAVREAFDLAAGAGADGLTARLAQFTDPEWDQGFGAGSFATVACPAWMVGYIKGKAGDAGEGLWDVTPLPGGAGGNWGGAYLAVPEASENQEEAVALATWLTAPEQQQKVFEVGGNFPGRTAAIEAVADVTDPYFQDAPIGEIFGASAEAAPVQVLGADDGVVKGAMTDALLSVEVNDVPVEDAWTAAVREADNQVG